jgi:hypothetical protein
MQFPEGLEDSPLKTHSLYYKNRNSLCPHSHRENLAFITDISLHALHHVLISFFVSVENQHHDAICIDQLQFYGTPKLAIEGTPFARCHLPAHTWAESHLVEKYSLNSNQRIQEMPGRVQSRFEFHF